MQNLTLKPEEIAKIAKDGKGSMPKGVFKGTDEELKKLSEFVAKYNKNNRKADYKFCGQLFILMTESLLYNRVEFEERMKGVGHTAWFTCMQC